MNTLQITLSKKPTIQQEGRNFRRTGFWVCFITNDYLGPEAVEIHSSDQFLFSVFFIRDERGAHRAPKRGDQ